MARPAQLFIEDGFGAVVGGRDEIRRALDADLQMLDLAEVAREAAARFPGGIDHDRHQRRGRHRFYSRVELWNGPPVSGPRRRIPLILSSPQWEKGRQL